MIAGDLATQAEALLAGTQPGTELSDVEVKPVEDAKVGVQVTLTRRTTWAAPRTPARARSALAS